MRNISSPAQGYDRTSVRKQNGIIGKSTLLSRGGHSRLLFLSCSDVASSRAVFLDSGIRDRPHLMERSSTTQ